MTNRHDHSLLFRFTDSESASVAVSTLRELGYDVAAGGSTEIRLSLHGSDLTSALEIAFAHGGELDVPDDAITIPAHMVNEDLVAWEEGFSLSSASASPEPYGELGLHNRDEAMEGEEAFPEQDDSLSYFSGDVRM
jgi:hypothetical protein